MPATTSLPPAPRRARRCAFCGQPGKHPECAEAFGLDYDPTSQADARAWLAARREMTSKLLGEE